MSKLSPYCLTMAKWHRVPKLPRFARGHSREELIALRIQLKRLLRSAQQCAAAVPHLADKQWARDWRSQHAGDYERIVRQCRKELATIAQAIGPEPKTWKPRSTPWLARMARIFRPAIKATSPLWADAFTHDCEESPYRRAA